MSTYEPGKLYLYERHGETVTGLWNGRYLISSAYTNLPKEVTNPRLAVVLDPEDEEVQAFATGHGKVGHVGCCAVAAKIRAQITPPEPPMEEPTEWGSVVQTDEGRAVLATNKRETRLWILEDRGWVAWKSLKNPREYEG